MKPFLFLLFLLSFLFTCDFFAQKEASIWPLENGNQINFKSGSFEYSSFDKGNDINATICDANGELLLYTNGKTVWNSKGETLENGDDIIGNNTLVHFEKPFFVPAPGKLGQYFLICPTRPKDNYETEDKKLVYATIDINGNAGKGEVLSKNILIHQNYHGSHTIAGFCDNSYFWLLVEGNDNIIRDIERDRIYFYKIDKNGINPKPLINDSLDIGCSSEYKFSPNGNNFYFSYAPNYSNNDGEDYYNMIADFNFTNGEMYNFRSIGDEDYSHPEFSPNSKLLYLFSGPELIQFDATFSEGKRITNSADTLLTLSTSEEISSPGGDLQLAPDGKLYFYYYDVSKKTYKLGQINKPDNKGKACGAQLDVLELEYNMYPNFPAFATSFFRIKHPELKDEVFPNAGGDIRLCSNSSTNIGYNSQNEALYQWIPDINIRDQFSSTATYTPMVPVYGEPEYSELTLRASDGNCWLNFDTIKVSTLPIPKAQAIDGSWSVCPYVEEVKYWTNNERWWHDHEETELNWLVNGGEIADHISTDTITIDWLESNSKALVAVYAINNYACVSDTSLFPVRVNVELMTQTPVGSDELCIAKSKNVSYQITNTNGSVYDWAVDHGEIIEGQGTNTVVVNWTDEGDHSIWVEESNLTIDTICYGESSPLNVHVRNDSLDIHLESASFNKENNVDLLFSANGDNDKISEFYLTVDHQNEIRNNRYLEENILYLPKQKYSSEIIQLKAINTCNEVFYSNSQETIFLEGHELQSDNLINLKWNRNRFWEDHILLHEIWHSVDGEDWKRIVLGEDITEFDYELQGLSLIHYFKVKEINKNLEKYSWSNRIRIEVKGKIKIPDVFTPNGDGYNDLWEIRNINFEQFNSLTVFDRFGQKVYHCKNEYVPWHGKIDGKIIQGTYFYELHLSNHNIKYGKVTILK